MKKMAVSILCSTGITLIVLAVFGTISGARFLLIGGVFQSFLANIIIHSGLQVTHRFESSYAVLEFMVDISYTMAVVIGCGAVFDWYSSTPVGMLAVMTALIYTISILLSIIKVRQKVEEINELLRRRNGRSILEEIK